MQKTDREKPKKHIRRITIIILSLVGLCLLTAGISFISNQFLPKASPSTDKLTQEDLFRAEETLNLMTNLGEQIWPDLNSSIPLILWNESHAFLLNSQEYFEDWRVLEDAEVNNLPVYIQENKANYQAFTELLSNGRYAGSLATKDTTNIGFINLFKENLPPVISQIFPYQILLLSTDHYITALVHESFHAYQAENYPERFEDAEKSYQSTDAYKDIFPVMTEDWQIEVQILLEALEEEDRGKQITLVKNFLETRENRREKAGLAENLVLYEKRYEWLEGSAKYVELEIWKQAANSTDYQPVDEIFIDQDFDDYQGYEKRWKNEKTNMKNAAKNIGDSLFYYTCMLQARLLDILTPDWKTKIGESDIWYEDLLADAIS